MRKKRFYMFRNLLKSSPTLFSAVRQASRSAKSAKKDVLAELLRRSELPHSAVEIGEKIRQLGQAEEKIARAKKELKQARIEYCVEYRDLFGRQSELEKGLKWLSDIVDEECDRIQEERKHYLGRR